MVAHDFARPRVFYYWRFAFNLMQFPENVISDVKSQSFVKIKKTFDKKANIRRRHFSFALKKPFMERAKGFSRKSPATLFAFPNFAKS